MNYSRKITKALHAAHTILKTGPKTWSIARAACKEGATQHWSELSQLLHVLRDLHPSRIMEIGMDRGGTMALWSQIADPHACLIGLDIKIGAGVEARIRSNLQVSQTLWLIEADSHTAAAKQRVVEALGENKLDFLFIDGDHTYEGVKQDLENYRSLVRPGGLIALHDIVPDYNVRFGIQTDHNAGGVHQFWREISRSFAHYEFVESVAQDGYGIGVIRL
jgi:cephalosporin hydroxylase